MHVEIAADGGKPYGSYIHLDHAEACELTGPSSEAALGRIAAVSGAYASVVARAVRAQVRRIRTQNEWSAGEGVRLLFVWGTGTIAAVEPRAVATAPCAGPCCRSPEGRAEIPPQR